MKNKEHSQSYRPLIQTLILGSFPEVKRPEGEAGQTIYCVVKE